MFEPPANANIPSTVFTFHSDPGHGWLFVPWAVIIDLGIDTDVFTTYSYVDDKGMYLEEDVDGPMFEKLYTATTGKRIAFQDEASIEYSEIRDKQRHQKLADINEVVMGGLKWFRLSALIKSALVDKQESVQ